MAALWVLAQLGALPLLASPQAEAPAEAPASAEAQNELWNEPEDATPPPAEPAPSDEGEAETPAAPVEPAPGDAAAEPGGFESAPEATPRPATEPEAGLSKEPAPDDPAGGLHNQPKWDDAMEMGEMLGDGSIEVCETLTTPLGLIPWVGTFVGVFFELACLYPGALAVDYVSLFHGKSDSQLWQAASAVILAKLWRVGTRFLAIGAITLAAGATLLAAAVVLGGAAFSAFTAGTPLQNIGYNAIIWAPTLLGTVLALSGFTYIVLRKLRKYGQGKIYDWVYDGLTDDFESEGAQIEAQKLAYVHPPLGWWERAWVLMAMAGGSEPEGDWMHAVPVFGRVVKAQDSAEALKGHMRKVGRDMLHEEPDKLESMDREMAAMDRTIDFLALLEGGLGALAEAGLIIGGGFASVGLLMVAVNAALQPDLLVFGSLTTAVGLAAVAFGGAGLTFLLLREVPKIVRPFAVSLAYGPLPFSWLEEGEGADEAATDEDGDPDDDDDEDGEGSEGKGRGGREDA